MPAKTLPLQLHVYAMQRNTNMHKVKSSQMCKITAPVGTRSHSAFVGCVHLLEILSLLPLSCGRKQARAQNAPLTDAGS